MKEKVGYIIGALIVYFIGGIAVSYFSYSAIEWDYVLFWTIAMTVGDFFILRKIKAYFLAKRNKN